LILIRGFGGVKVEDEKRIAYQGFNDGTVYPHKRGDNYIYEGLILRLLKSNWKYQDATNVIGYYSSPVLDRAPEIDPELQQRFPEISPDFFGGTSSEEYETQDEGKFKVVIDQAMALHLLQSAEDVYKTIWVFRYYDLDDRAFAAYGAALVRLIDFIRVLATKKDESAPKVNIIAHSMGGLLVREAIQSTYPSDQRRASDYVNRVVTLGTPHQGISFQLLKNWILLGAEEELERFSPDLQKSESKEFSFKNLKKHFPLERLLTIVGTDYRSYGSEAASIANRFFSVPGEFGPNYNRSDGLVKQKYAQIPGAPRTFVHKCHGGVDSLVTSREGFEIATRFFFGNVRARLRMIDSQITRGRDFFGRSEFFFGVSIKPRGVDFDLFHQSAAAENCYGPFNETDLSDEDVGFGWAGPDRLIWEGYLDTAPILTNTRKEVKDMVLRVDLYVGERDLRGVGFSDNVIFRSQYYVRALLQPKLRLYLYSDERFEGENVAEIGEYGTQMEPTQNGWQFSVGRGQSDGRVEDDPGYYGVFQIEIDDVPVVGLPKQRVPVKEESVAAPE